jgi:hypothetical protein
LPVRGARVPPPAMFLFFSNRMGCLPSLLLSAFLTFLVLLLTGIVDL